MNRFILCGELPPNVILTDDPLRVKMLAAHHMELAKPLYEQRGMCAFGGEYRGAGVAVIACGFGETAVRLYLREARALGAANAVYIGECVSLAADIGLMELIIAKGGGTRLAKAASSAAHEFSIRTKTMAARTDDRFWLGNEAPEGTMIVDFAADAFYNEAKDMNMEALALLTVTENAQLKERADEAARQSRFNNAARLAFETLAYGQRQA